MIKSPTRPWLFSTALPYNVGLYKKRVQKRLCCVAQTCAQGYLLLCKPQFPLAESSPTGWRSLPQLREFCTPTTAGCSVGRRNQAPSTTSRTRTLVALSCLYSQFFELSSLSHILLGHGQHFRPLLRRHSSCRGPILLCGCGSLVVRKYGCPRHIHQLTMCPSCDVDEVKFLFHVLGHTF